MMDTTISQVFAVDRKRLSELVMKAKGAERTMAQFATDTGISAPTLSRIVNGKINNALSQDSLKKIYDARCESADFPYGSLLAANGMVDSAMVDRGQDYVQKFFSKREEGRQLERRMKNAVMNALLDRGFVVQSIPDELNTRKNRPSNGMKAPYDFDFYLPGEALPLWYFETVGGTKSLPQSNRATISANQMFLIDAWDSGYFRGQKTSFLFQYRLLYEQFVERYRNAPIQNAFTAILIDIESERIIEETWLSSSPEIPSVLTLPIPDETVESVSEDDYLEDEFEEDFECPDIRDLI